MPTITTNQGVILDPGEVATESYDQLANEGQEPGGVKAQQGE